MRRRNISIKMFRRRLLTRKLSPRFCTTKVQFDRTVCLPQYFHLRFKLCTLNLKHKKTSRFAFVVLVFMIMVILCRALCLCLCPARKATFVRQTTPNTAWSHTLRDKKLSSTGKIALGATVGDIILSLPCNWVFLFLRGIFRRRKGKRED